jgi:hypothetical protein
MHYLMSWIGIYYRVTEMGGERRRDGEGESDRIESVLKGLKNMNETERGH